MSKSCGGACGGDATSAADTDIQASSVAPGRWVSVYAVPKMDCPSEGRMIRLALNGFEEIRALSFDLSNRRLKVVHDGEVEPVTSKDRKSTRLNSSHVRISYAVFCLKKKTNVQHY